ncbi:MAG TPA: AraD1 family protein [Terracidiphilus sp.]|nr:AraD1 family protein [Terracidiphilus sp.]
MTNLVQICKDVERRVALVDEPRLRCLAGVPSVYELAQRCISAGLGLREQAARLATGESLDYDAVYSGASAWRLLTPIDVPGEPSRLIVSGTGLTHLGSARDRDAMHASGEEETAGETEDASMTDSMRIFKWGLKGGRPAPQEIGTAPEWFYKGNGTVLRAPFEPLTVPAFGEDGGEEAEIAGVYIIGPDGTPWRAGMATGNEFSDHQFEKQNYLYLAGSKLRACSIGPELAAGTDFVSVTGRVSIQRGAQTVWSKEIATGETNMCHSLANLEHHHFKYPGHRRPGDVHVHYYGAHSLSYGDGVVLEEGDVMEVCFEGFGRALRNPIHMECKQDHRLVSVRSLA